MSYTQRSKKNISSSSSNKDDGVLTSFFKTWIDSISCTCGSPDTVDDDCSSVAMRDAFDEASLYDDKKEEWLGKRRQQTPTATASSHLYDESIGSIHRNETLLMGNTMSPLATVQRRFSFSDEATGKNNTNTEEEDAIREAPPSCGTTTTTKTRLSMLKKSDLQVLSQSPTNTYTTVSLSSLEDDGSQLSCVESTVSTQVVSNAVLPFRKRQRDEEEPSSSSSEPYRQLLRMKPQNYVHYSTTSSSSDANDYDNAYCLGELTYLRPVLYNDERVLEPPMIPELK